MASLAKATEVVRAAEQDPNIAPLVEHMDETGKVEPAHKALRSLPGQPTPEEVARAIESRKSAIAANPEMAAAEQLTDVRAAWADAWVQLRKAMKRIEAAHVDALDRDDLEVLSWDLDDLRPWLTGLEAAYSEARTPRIVKGDDS